MRWDTKVAIIAALYLVMVIGLATWKIVRDSSSVYISQAIPGTSPPASSASTDSAPVSRP
jgi:hypothetical protein